MKKQLTTAMITLLTLTSANASTNISDLYNDVSTKYEEEYSERQAETKAKRLERLFSKAVAKTMESKLGIILDNPKVQRKVSEKSPARGYYNYTIEERYMQNEERVCKFRSVMSEAKSDEGIAKLMNSINVSASCYDLDRSRKLEAEHEELITDLQL